MKRPSTSRLMIFAVAMLCTTQTATANLSVDYAIHANLTYLTADGVDLKLDVYAPNVSTDARPTVIFYHGGGWVAGNKERSSKHLLPYLEQGYVGVNVAYRLGGVALAPAAVEDARCAYWWVVRNAEQFHIDPNRIVLTGRSAGGHLALITGMLTADAGLDRRCPQRTGGDAPDRSSAGLPESNVAAIVNWAGITDVNDLISGPNQTAYAIRWLGAQTDREAIARRVSPLTYVRQALPPILTIHGDRDLVVPYTHGVRLHEALLASGATTMLHTIEGKEHFNFAPEEVKQANAVIFDFLQRHVGK